MSDIYLLNCTIKGIKNIEKEIRLDFYKKVVDKNFDPEKYKVKAIYGENGSGKTAIITAISVAKNIFLIPGYLKQEKTQLFLSEIINKKTQHFYFDTEFLYRENEKNLKVYNYSVVVSNNGMGKYEITHEELNEKNGNTNTNAYKPIFSIDNGTIQSLNIEQKLRNIIEKKMINLLSDDSFFSVFSEKVDFSEMELGNGIVNQIIASLLFFVSLRVYLDQEDTHEHYFFRQIKAKLNLNDKAELVKLLELREQQDLYFSSRNIDKVLIKNFKKYESKIKRLESFIKIYKKELKKIKIDKREDGKYFNCELVFQYDGYSVNREFESTGIKKLVKLFECLSAASSGEIVFIDEIDSNINDVYLCKMIEYFMYYGKGQLCITTHNVDLMEILKDNKNSIDFLSSDNHMVSWKIKGNATPENYYRNGMIKYLPFNIDSVDFIGIFEE